MLIKIAGRVRGFFAGNYPENKEDEEFHLNTRGDMLVAQGLPERAELTRLGDSWTASNTTGIAALTGWPTTTAGFGIWNGEPSNGKCYVIDSVSCTDIVVDATQGDCTALFVMLNKPPVALPAGGQLIRGLSGRTYGGRALTVLTAVARVDEGWFPAGSSATVGATVAGCNFKQQYAPLNGMYIVPPGGMFSVAAAKVAAAAAQVVYTICWHEVQLILKS